MTTEVLEPGDGGLDRLADALESGAVVAVPTDTVYGLAARPADPGALARLFALKRRPTDVTLPVLVGRRDQVDAVAGRLGPAAACLAGRHWPGPLTLVVPRSPGFTADLGGGPDSAGTVGIRWPAHAVVEALLRRVGPLAVTSANLHGAPPATSASAVLEAFAMSADLAAVLDGGTCDGAPSTVVECRGWSARGLRRGSLSWADPAEAEEAGGGWLDLRRPPPPGRG